MNKSYLLRAIRDTRGAPSTGTVAGIAKDTSGNAVPTTSDQDRINRISQALDISPAGQTVSAVETLATTALGGITYQSGSRR